jgi:DNA-binding NtrC family response regulator
MRILLIDDDRDSLENLGLLLEKKGFSSLRFTEPLKALEIVRSKRIELVITDYEMPHMDGLEVLRKVREMIPSIPVIIMSACPDYKLDQRMADPRFNCAFFDKPLDLKLFMKSLAKIRDNLRKTGEQGNRQ